MLYEDEIDKEAYDREMEAKPDKMNNLIFQDYGDDYDDYAQKRKRKLFSLDLQETNNTLKNTSDTRRHRVELQRKQERDGVPQPVPQIPAQPLQTTQASKHHLRQNRTELKLEGQMKKAEQMKPKGKLRPTKRQKLKSVENAVRPGEPQIKAKEQEAVPSEQLSKQQHMQRPRKMNHTQIQGFKDSKLQPLERDAPLPEKPTVAKQQRFAVREMELQPAATKRVANPKRDMERPVGRLDQWDTDTKKRLREKEKEMKMPLQDLENGVHKAKAIGKGNINVRWYDMKGVEDQAKEKDKFHNRAESRRDTGVGERDSLWGPADDFEGTDDEDLTPAPVFDTEVSWNQTFQVNHLDLQAQRSDWIDLHCNVSGNLLLQSSDALSVVKAFMDELNEKHHG